jgi:hypothetical protein
MTSIPLSKFLKICQCLSQVQMALEIVIGTLSSSLKAKCKRLRTHARRNAQEPYLPTEHCVSPDSELESRTGKPLK